MSSEVLEIYINSRNASQYYDGMISNALYILPHIEILQDEKAYVCIKSAVIPYSFYNINSTNNILNYILNGVSLSITLVKGNYNINTLKAHLIELLGTNWSIAYITKTNKLEFTHTLYEFSFLASSTCFELIGFIDNITYTSIDSFLSSNISINLFTIKNIYICSDNFILNNIDASNHNKSNIICSVPVNGSMNSILFYNDKTKHLVHKLNNLTNFKLTLTDEDGALIDLNNVNYSITMEITIEKL